MLGGGTSRFRRSGNGCRRRRPARPRPRPRRSRAPSAARDARGPGQARRHATPRAVRRRVRRLGRQREAPGRAPTRSRTARRWRRLGRDAGRPRRQARAAPVPCPFRAAFHGKGVLKFGGAAHCGGTGAFHEVRRPLAGGYRYEGAFRNHRFHGRGAYSGSRPAVRGLFEDGAMTGRGVAGPGRAAGAGTTWTAGARAAATSRGGAGRRYRGEFADGYPQSARAASTSNGKFGPGGTCHGRLRASVRLPARQTRPPPAGPRRGGASPATNAGRRVPMRPRRRRASRASAGPVGGERTSSATRLERARREGRRVVVVQLSRLPSPAARTAPCLYQYPCAPRSRGEARQPHDRAARGQRGPPRAQEPRRARRVERRARLVDDRPRPRRRRRPTTPSERAGRPRRAGLRHLGRVPRRRTAGGAQKRTFAHRGRPRAARVAGVAPSAEPRDAVDAVSPMIRAPGCASRHRHVARPTPQPTTYSDGAAGAARRHRP